MRLVAVAAKASCGNLLIHPIHYVKNQIALQDPARFASPVVADAKRPSLFLYAQSVPVAAGQYP